MSVQRRYLSSDWLVITSLQGERLDYKGSLKLYVCLSSKAGGERLKDIKVYGTAVSWNVM